MRCAKLVAPKTFEIGEINEPEAKDGRVIIDVKKTGICGSDLHYFEVGQPEGLVLGHEYSGVVVDPGSRTDLKVGDRVTGLPISPCLECEACVNGQIQYCAKTWDQATGLSLTDPGALSPRISVRPDMVCALPDNVSFEEGAMVEPSAVGLHAVNLADVKVGDNVLIIGGGIIGLVSAMFAKMNGAGYIACSEANPLRGENSVELGDVDEYLDAKDPEFVQKCKEKTNGGFDIVIECCGNAPAVTSAIMACKPGGKVVLAGVSLKPIEIPVVQAVLGEITLQGAIAYNKDEFQTVIDLMADEKIDVLKFKSDEVGLEEVQASYERLFGGKDAAIKILVDPNK